MDAAKAQAIGVVAGLAAGALVYHRMSAPPACAGVSGQTLLQVIASAEQHPFEDFVLGLLGDADTQVQGLTLGQFNPGWAADFYSWWHGLSDAQKQAVQQSASNGAEACAALETAKQLASGAGAIVSAVVVGTLAYLLTPLALEAIE